MSLSIFTHIGFCPICEKESTFVSEFDWFRDHFVCKRCASIPRERALMKIIQEVCPDYKNKAIHESSPMVNRGASKKLLEECTKYTSSHYFANNEIGSMVKGFRNESIEHLTFNDNSFDLFISQDVMEHIPYPEKAFSEINRVLKSGGMHIFTVPLVNKFNTTIRRVKYDKNNTPEYLLEKVYHGNPTDENGSLVIMDWGYDIVECIYKNSGMNSVIMHIDNVDLGIRAEYIEVVVSKKS